MAILDKGVDWTVFMSTDVVSVGKSLLTSVTQLWADVHRVTKQRILLQQRRTNGINKVSAFATMFPANSKHVICIVNNGTLHDQGPTHQTQREDVCQSTASPFLKCKGYGRGRSMFH